MDATNPPSLARGLQEFLSRSPATIAVETSILLLIGLIAIGGNLLVVISIYRNPSLRTTTNYFVFALSMTDIFYPVMVVSITIVASIESKFSLGQAACDFQATSSASLVVVSVNTIALMAVNRFIRVCKPPKYKKIFNTKTLLIMIGGVWITSFTAMTLNLMVGDLVYSRFSPYKIMCLFAYNEEKKPGVIVSNLPHVFLLFLPFIIIIYCYSRVFKKIREHKRRVAPSSNSNANSLGTSVQEIKVTWLLFAILLGYCLTWVPVLAIFLASNIGSRYNYHLPRQFHVIATYAVASSSSINPIIYGFSSRAFRKEYKKILRCK